MKTKNKESVVFFALSVFLLFYSLYKHYGGIEIAWELSPYLFSLLISIFGIILSVFLFFDKSKTVDKEDVIWKNLIFIIIVTFINIFLMRIIGFIISTVLFLIVLFIYFGEKRWWLIAIVSVATPLILYFLFAILLNVMLP